MGRDSQSRHLLPVNLSSLQLARKTTYREGGLRTVRTCSQSLYRSGGSGLLHANLKRPREGGLRTVRTCSQSLYRSGGSGLLHANLSVGTARDERAASRPGGLHQRSMRSHRHLLPFSHVALHVHQSSRVKQRHHRVSSTRSTASFIRCLANRMYPEYHTLRKDSHTG
jgi:hypothetical protein